MREIKFRFVLECDGDLYYSKVVKNMNEIIEHNYLIDELIEDGGCNQGNIAFNDAFLDRDWIIQHTPQFTGLKDKNGVEIYEDDIVIFKDDWTDKNRTFIFRWRSTGFWLWDIMQDDCSNSVSRDEDDYEVIGNIYENGDLLK